MLQNFPLFVMYSTAYFVSSRSHHSQHPRGCHSSEANACFKICIDFFSSLPPPLSPTPNYIHLLVATFRFKSCRKRISGKKGKSSSRNPHKLRASKITFQHEFNRNLFYFRSENLECRSIDHAYLM